MSTTSTIPNPSINPATGATWADGDTLECECRQVVNVGKGGYGNLVRHRSSKKHRDAMAAKQSKPMTSFFAKKVKQPAAAAPPPLVNTPSSSAVAIDIEADTVLASLPSNVPAVSSEDHTGTDNELEFELQWSSSGADINPETALSSTGPNFQSTSPGWLSRFREAITALPAHVLICAEDDVRAEFAYGPIIDPEEDDVLQTLIDFIELWLPLDEPAIQLLPLVTRGLYGLDRVADWIGAFLVQYQIDDALCGPIAACIDRFTDILRRFTRHDQADGVRTVPVPDWDVGMSFEDDDLDSATIDISPGHPPFAVTDPPSSLPIRCSAFELALPEGVSSFEAYPLAAHSLARLPWELEFRSTGRLFLRSFRCTSVVPSTSPVCTACASLSEHPALFGIFSRIHGGAKEHTNNYWLGAAQLDAKIKRLENENNTVKLNGVNTGRKLAACAKNLSQYKRFMQIVAEGDIPRLAVAVRVALNNGQGINSILDMLALAAARLYMPASFEEKEYRLAYVLYKYGGASSANIVHHALGLPSSRTVLRHVSIAMIPITISYPTVDEVAQTIRAVFPAPIFQRIIGSVVMFDEVHVEPRPRYDAIDDTNKGFCRQHSDGFCLKFGSLDDVKAVFAGLDAGEIHLATEATVAAIGALLPGTREHAARPIHISGSCKREDATQHAALISSIVDACASTREIHGTRVYCIASDGESKRGKALALLTLKQPLSASSRIYPLLSPLPLFNLHCGDDDVTADKDYKHVFKRLRGLLLREAGINVFGVYITRDIVRRHLVACGLSPARADALLDPNDLQDVVLAVTLLAKVMQMRPLDDSDPSLARVRHALCFLGHLFGAIVRPYTTVSYSLREQLNSLSTAAHLLFALYSHGRGSVMPVLLYVDIMLMIKNVYFCVAKTKMDDPGGRFYIILLGTDRLEIVFGKMRCMIASDCNADMLQLRERLTGAAECAYILATHPEWDEQPRRLRVPSLDENGELLLNSAIDHINPQSWVGDLSVDSASLQTAWTIGRQRASTILTQYKSFDFAQAAKQPNVDMLQPFGRLSVRDGLADGESDEVEDACMAPAPPSAPDPRTSTASPSSDDIEPDLDDMSSAALADQATSSIKPYIELDGKKVYKASIIRLFASPGFRNSPDSTDRLKRVRNYKRFDTSSNELALQLPDPSDTSYLQVNDPAATLLRCDNQTFLAVVQISAIKVDGHSQLAITPSQTTASTVSVKCQVLALKARVPDPTNDLDIYDWETDCSPASGLIDVGGRMLECIDPVTVSTTVGDNRRVVFRLSTQEILAITAVLHERVAQLASISIPAVEPSSSYPYVYNDRACFACEAKDGGPLGLIKNGCEICGSALPAFASPQQQLSHMASHILFDPALKGSVGLCGFCLQPNNVCTWFLTNSRGTTTLPSVIMRDSVCPKKPARFSVKSAAKSTKSSPSTNTPLRCPLCPARAPAIWRYNFKLHLELAHTGCDVQQHHDMWHISAAEKFALGELWEKNQATVRKPRRKAAQKQILLSEAHTSRLLMRTTDIGTSSTQPAAHNATSSNDPASDSGDDTDDESLLGDLPGGSHDDAEAGDPPREETAAAVDHSLDLTAPQMDSVSTRDTGSVLPPSQSPATGDVRALSGPIIEPQNVGIPVPRASRTKAGSAGTTMAAPAATREGTRKHNANSLTLLETCICGKGPLLKSGEFPPREEDMIECTRAGCESRYYHRRCMEFEPNEVVPRWVCQHCKLEGGSGSSSRRAKRQRKDSKI